MSKMGRVGGRGAERREEKKKSVTVTLVNVEEEHQKAEEEFLGRAVTRGLSLS